MIKVEGLCLDFPGSLDLSIDKLVIEKGSILGIIGPNGAGKSTFLNILALFQRPQRGSIEVFGEDILSLKDPLNFRRNISFVFSRPYLLNGTVYDNVELPLRLRGRRDPNLVKEILALFEITRLREDKVLSLSQGQMHRVSLARAFVTLPKLLLLDEPFLSLECGYKEALIRQLRRIIKLNAITAVFVTQDQSEALSLADTLAVMKGGRILQAGSPHEIFTRPASKEVADFIGIETVIEGRIVRKEGDLCFIKVNDKVLEIVSRQEEGEEVFISIRPEEVTISTRLETNSARNHFKARIINIEPWRLTHKIILDCGFNLVSFVTRQSIQDLRLATGQEVFVSFKATAPHVIARGKEWIRAGFSPSTAVR